METHSNNAAYSEEAFAPQNKKQLSLIVGVSIYILNKWLEDIKDQLGPCKGRLFSAKQVEIVVKNFGCLPQKHK